MIVGQLALLCSNTWPYRSLHSSVAVSPLINAYLRVRPRSGTQAESRWRCPWRRRDGVSANACAAGEMLPNEGLLNYTHRPAGRNHAFTRTVHCASRAAQPRVSASASCMEIVDLMLTLTSSARIIFSLRRNFLASDVQLLPTAYQC